MTDTRPEPLVPAEVDLRDLDGFMLNVERLLASELFALSTGDEFKAAVGLWSRAWKQMPAGSLPNDDRVLAAFSGAGTRWRKVREMALRGFVECSDGRLYHKVLCDDVLRAWARKQEYTDEQRADADRKRREREDRSRMFVSLKDAGVTPPWNIKTSDLRKLVTERVTQPVTGKQPPVTPPVTRTVTANTVQDSTGQDQEDAQTPSPSPTENKKLNSHLSTGNGSGDRGARAVTTETGIAEQAVTREGRIARKNGVTIEDPHERMARFQQSLATRLGPNGWAVVIAATQRSDPQHAQSLALCKRACSDLGKGWPKAWPIT